MRTYTEFQNADRSYPVLTHEQRQQLSEIESTRNQVMEQWPCSVELRSGEVIQNVYIANATSYIKVWGVWPEDDPDKSAIDITDVRKIAASPNRLPAQIANDLYSSEESGMGYSIVYLEFSDGSSAKCLAGNAIDFLSLPEGKRTNDIVNAKLVRDSDLAGLQDPPTYAWALFGSE